MYRTMEKQKEQKQTAEQVRQNVDKRTWLQIFRAEIDEVNKYRQQQERQRAIDEIRRQAL